jgi:hypothetical protein
LRQSLGSCAYRKACLFFSDRARHFVERTTEKAMTKHSLLGIAAVAAFAALTVPTFAQNRPTHAVVSGYNGYEGVCPGREAGNPFDKNTDYGGWSAWRARGGWDDHNDLNCVPSRTIRGEF